MLICPLCSHQIKNDTFLCERCGFESTMQNGFRAWAPETEMSYGGFPQENFAKLAKIESESFWFCARNALIIWALEKYFPRFESLLEIGCGTAYVLAGVARKFPKVRLVGSEIFTRGLSFAAERLPKATLIQADARCLPYEAEFDVVTAFDVVEHIKEDELVFENIFRATRLGGGCLITVPQHKWLWSPIDEAACHERRYEANELLRKIEAAGFKIVMSTSFVSFLVPLMLLSRLNSRRSDEAAGEAELLPNKFINAILEMIMGIERICIKMGVRFPFGGSRLVVAIK